jgi:hypothetical protein
VPTLNKASYLGPFKILLSQHLAKCPTPTHRSLGLVSMLMQMFGVENYMIVVSKKWGEESIDNESRVVNSDDLRGRTKDKYIEVLIIEAKCKAATVT